MKYSRSAPTPINQPEECCLCGEAIEIQRHPETGKVIWAFGHNAHPLKNGRCCDVCNTTKVVPRRIKRMENQRNSKKKAKKLFAALDARRAKEEKDRNL